MPRARNSISFTAAILLVASVSNQRVEAADSFEDASLSIARVDGSKIRVDIVRPSVKGQIPILMAIGGSICMPTRTSEQIERLSPKVSQKGDYALVIVETPGPTIPKQSADGSYEIGPAFICSDAFKKHYSIDERAMDHLRAIQYLRRHAPWWNGKLFIWGYSDGGRIGSRVAAYSPETVRVMLGGFGGGVPMAREFEDFHICSPTKLTDRADCLSKVRAQFDAIRLNPTSTETWNGDSNTYKAWSSRIDAVEAHLLIDLSVPLLLIHGTEDKSVPVSSARALAKDLATSGGPPFEYREVEGMGHGLGIGLPTEQSDKLQASILDWLLHGPPPPTSATH